MYSSCFSHKTQTSGGLLGNLSIFRLGIAFLSFFLYLIAELVAYKMVRRECIEPNIAGGFVWVGARVCHRVALYRETERSWAELRGVFVLGSGAISGSSTWVFGLSEEFLIFLCASILLFGAFIWAAWVLRSERDSVFLGCQWAWCWTFCWFSGSFYFFGEVKQDRPFGSFP